MTKEQARCIMLGQLSVASPGLPYDFGWALWKLFSVFASTMVHACVILFVATMKTLELIGGSFAQPGEQTL